MDGIAQGREGDHGVGFAGAFPSSDSGFETPLRLFVRQGRAISLVSATAAFPVGVVSGCEGRW